MSVDWRIITKNQSRQRTNRQRGHRKRTKSKTNKQTYKHINELRKSGKGQTNTLADKQTLRDKRTNRQKRQIDRQ